MTTDPLANLAILPVSIAMVRDPISNSSRKVSRTLEPGTGAVAGDSVSGGWERKPRRPLQKERKPKRRHVRKEGTDAIRGFALPLRAAAAAMAKLEEEAQKGRRQEKQRNRGNGGLGFKVLSSGRKESELTAS